MAELPGSPTIDAIYAEYERERQDETPRPYLGGSRIGHECRRMLWLEFRWAWPAEFPGRILRLFESGHREEDRVVDNLRDVGVTVEGQQYEVVAVDGHFKGHLDGALLGLLEAPNTWHVFDAKSSKNTEFNKFIKHGVEKWKPEYFGQLQVYMHLTGMTRSVVYVVCKNDDNMELERVPYDKAKAEALMRKAAAIIYASEPPPRIGKNSDFFKCKFCNMRRICWEQVFPVVSCRSCAHSTPERGGDGLWSCAMGYDMGADCQEHIYIPALVHWLEPVDGHPTWVEYENFVNCAATGFPARDKETYSSRFLYEATKDA